jgi:hypothetical protein
MSTNREPARSRADDELVGVLSRWLAGHVEDAELRTAIDAVRLDRLDPEQAEGVRELLDDLGRNATRAELQVSVRETLELLSR